MDQEQKQLAEELLFSEERAPSFAKQLYFGRFDPSAVMPFPTVDPEERSRTDTLMDRLQAFMDDKLDPDAIDRNAEIPQNVISGLGDMGILGVTIPKQYGGLGMTQYAYCRAAEEISRRCGATALFVNAHQSIGLKALVLFGTEKQKRTWLPDLAAGRKLAAFALTEPNAGSDAGGVETRAKWDAVNQVYRITGRKQWITNGAVAGMLTVMARTEDGKISAFIVTPDMPGFKVHTAALEKVGMRGSKTAILDFDNVAVPAENILGPKGGGLRVCLTVLDYGRTTFGATCTGAAKQCLERAIRHAKTRHQFKRPLSSFPLIKSKIAEMAALTYAMDATTYLTAGLLDGEQEDIMLESAMLKVFNSEALWLIIYETMQIFGGRSFFTDEPFERMMRDARLNLIGEGANEVMRAFIGAVGMRDVGMQLKDGVDALKHPLSNLGLIWEFTKGALAKLRKPEVVLQSKRLSNEIDQFTMRLRRFGLGIPPLLAKHRENIVEKQLQLNRIAECAMSLYTLSAVLAKIDTAIDCSTATETEIATAKYYCRLAFKNFDRHYAGVRNNHDKATEALSDMLTGWKPK